MKWGWLVLLAGVVALMIIAFYVHTGEGSSKSTILEKNENLRRQLKKERVQYMAQIREHRKIARPILEPTPEGNRRLARAFFNDEYYCAFEIIDGETGGTWRHDIAYGGRYGAH